MTRARLGGGLAALVMLLALGALAQPGGPWPDTAEAQAGKCEVNGVEIPCDDPQIVQAHIPFCAYEHYHGTLAGAPDPNPEGCGHGPVIRNGQVPFAFFEGVVGLMTLLGMPEEQVADMAGALLGLDGVQSFRFASDPSGPPTISPGFGQIQDVGAALLTFEDGFMFDGSGGPPCDNLDGTNAGIPGDDGLLVLCGGAPLQAGTPYLSIFTQLEGQVPPAAPFAQNYSFFVNFGDGPTWQPLPQYPGDTWQGGSFFPFVTQDPGTGFFEFGASEVGPGNQLLDVPTDTVFLMGGDTFAMFTPASEFPGLAGSTLGQVGFGSAVHIHDGSFGACATCPSIVSVFPDVPREGLLEADGQFTASVELTIGENAIVVTGVDQVGGGSSSGGSQPSSTTGEGGSTSSGGDASTVTEGGSGFPIIPALIVTTVLVGGGLFWQRDRFFGRPQVVTVPGDSIINQIEGGPAILSGGDGAPPAAANPDPATSTPPPSTLVGEVEVDEDLVAGVAQYFKEQDEASTPTVTNRQRADWETALLREEAAQQRLIGEFQRLLDQVNAAWAEYRSAVDRYRSRFTLTMSGSTEMQAMLATWAETRGIAQKQDLAFAIVTLLWTGGQLALKGGKWLVSGGRAARQTADTAGDAAVAAEAAATYSSKTPSAFALQDMLEAKRAIGMQRLAAEAGVDLAEHMAKYADDAEAGYTALLQAAARARGWVSITAEAEHTISRLLVNGRAALAGRGAVAAEDIAILQRWAQTPGFWDKLGKSAGLMDEVGWLANWHDVHQYLSLLYTADDIAFLRALASSGGDLKQLAQTLGPAQTAALTSLDGTLAKVVANAPTFAAPGAASTAFQDRLASDPVSQLGDASSFVDQFGITGKFGGLDQAVNAGDVGGTVAEGGKLLGSELWDLVSSPFETYQEYKFTFEAQGVYDEFLRNHADELTDMSHALDDAYSALERLQRGLNSSGVGTGNGPLHRRKQELRDVLDDMQRQYDEGDQAWRDEFGDSFRERQAHITAKLAYIEGIEAQLAEIGGRLPQMMAWLDSIRRPGGQMRSFTSFIDPEIGVRLLSVQAYLDTALGAAYRGAATPAGTSPVEEGPGPEGVFEDTPPTPRTDGADGPSDEEVERKWNADMERLRNQWQEFDSIPEDYELDVDLNFDDLHFDDADGPAGQ